MILSHWSAEPLGEVFAVEQSEMPNLKPSGLWVTVDGDNDWPHWCEGAGFNLGNFKHRAIVTLRPDAKLGWIRTAPDLLRFTNRWAKALRPDMAHLLDISMFLDWHGIAAEYDGIIIPEMIWSMRLSHETSWYYGWDCTGGCIWNPRAIASVEREVREAAG